MAKDGSIFFGKTDLQGVRTALAEDAGYEMTPAELEQLATDTVAKLAKMTGQTPEAIAEVIRQNRAMRTLAHKIIHDALEIHGQIPVTFLVQAMTAPDTFGAIGMDAKLVESVLARMVDAGDVVEIGESVMLRAEK